MEVIHVCCICKKVLKKTIHPDNPELIKICEGKEIISHGLCIKCANKERKKLDLPSRSNDETINKSTK